MTAIAGEAAPEFAREPSWAVDRELGVSDVLGGATGSPHGCAAPSARRTP
jgi:hypothetical protein